MPPATKINGIRPAWTSADGRLTLHHGDCLDVLPTLRPESVRLLWTDPPYGHGNQDGDLQSARVRDGVEGARKRRCKVIVNDSQDEMRALVDAALEAAVPKMIRDCCCCCCCCAGGGGPRVTFAWLANRMDARGLSFFHAVVWDKSGRGHGLGWRFRRDYEFVMVSHRAGGRLSWMEDGTAVPNIVFVPPTANEHHPTEKPVDLIRWFIGLTTAPDDLVLDPFAGSGSTGVACLLTGRRFVGVELDAANVDAAVRRLERAARNPSCETRDFRRWNKAMNDKLSKLNGAT